MEKCFLAIDIGASSGRHIVGWIEEGRLVHKEIYRFANGAESSLKGRLFWNTVRLFREVVTGLKRAKELGYEPVSIGIDTWAVDYALLSEKDELVGRVYSYRDNRTEKAVKKVNGLVPFSEQYSKTGIQFQPFNTIYQLYDDKTSGRLNKANEMLMLPDYLNFLLTGVKKQEYTNATSTGLVNAQTHDWDEELIAKLGYKKSLFKPLSQPTEKVGMLKDEIAWEVGYNAMVVLPATHDTASAVLAAPIDENSPYISSGTWSLLGLEQPTARTDAHSRLANYSNEGSINYTFRYQKNIMGLWIIQSIRRELGEKFSFPDLAALARSKTVGETIDVNNNRFLSPKSMIDEINQAVGRVLGTASMMRVVYESLAKSYAEAIDELETNTGRHFDTINIIGGGCRDTFLNELTAKATGKKVIAGPVEATSLGNLAMQMIAMGEIADINTARKIIAKSYELKETTYE